MLVPGTLEAFGLVMVRTSAMVLSSPVLGIGTSFGEVKVALIFGLSVVIYAVAGTPLDGADVGTLAYGAMAARELLIGFFMGFLFQVMTLAVRTGGELIGHEMGMFMARQVDPESGIAFTLVSRIYENFFLLALLAVNGHHLLVRCLSESFRRAPVGELAATDSLGHVAQRMVGQMFGAGLAFAAPIMIFLMLVSILLGLLSRAVPQLNILEVSFTLRIALALVAMFLFAPLLEPALMDLFEQFSEWLGTVLDALEG